MKKLTREWVRKADEDLGSAKRLRQGKARYHDAVCFHCQQAAEKYLKAMLQEVGSAVPHTHNLIDLLTRLLSYDASLKTYQRALKSLSRFAVDYRYPGIWASARDAKGAVERATRIRSAIYHKLGIKLRSPKKRKKP